MICNACQTVVEISHTYSNATTRASRGVCAGCGKVYTIAAVLIEAERGKGARALARALELGSMRLELIDEVQLVVETEDGQDQ